MEGAPQVKADAANAYKMAMMRGEIPTRPCTGGSGSGFHCGEDATGVATNPTGLQWYTCALHHEGQPVIPIAEWWEQVGEYILACDSIERLGGLPPPPKHKEWCVTQHPIASKQYIQRCDCGAV